MEKEWEIGRETTITVRLNTANDRKIMESVV